MKIAWISAATIIDLRNSNNNFALLAVWSLRFDSVHECVTSEGLVDMQTRRNTNTTHTVHCTAAFTQIISQKLQRVCAVKL